MVFSALKAFFGGQKQVSLATVPLRLSVMHPSVKGDKNQILPTLPPLPFLLKEAANGTAEETLATR